MRDDNELYNAYNVLWGADACADCDPPTEAVVGAETRLRTAESEFNDASVQLSQKTKEIAQNQDPDAV